MKTLIITAHPSSLGFTHKIAEAYKTGAQSIGCEVEILDLYKESVKQSNLFFACPTLIIPQASRHRSFDFLDFL